MYTLTQLKAINEQVLELAKKSGATSATADIETGKGFSVSARMQELENIEHQQDKSLSITVYFGQKSGTASTSDFSEQGLQEIVKSVCDIAMYTIDDPYSGLPKKAELAQDIKDLNLNYSWHISIEEAIELAKNCEEVAFNVDKKIKNSEGATIYTYNGLFAHANSLGFNEGYPSSYHSISCGVVAKYKQSMERDSWHSSARDPLDLESIEVIGQTAGKRAVQRLQAQCLPTQETAVIFEAPLSAGLFSQFVSAVSGGNLYRKSSFLEDSIDKNIFPQWLSIMEDPHILKGLASAPFDAEGVATKPRSIIKDGILQSYFLSTYSAKKLGMISTGNAGGNHNLRFLHPEFSFNELLKKMDRGLLVTELLGSGVNLVTGDYSRGAAGFWVENGTIQYPVHEITVAGNLREMFLGLVAISNDVYRYSSKQVGSVLIDRMVVAGNT